MDADHAPAHVEEWPSGIPADQWAIGLKHETGSEKPAKPCDNRPAGIKPAGMPQGQDPVPWLDAGSVSHIDERPGPALRDLHQCRIHLVVRSERLATRDPAVRKCKIDRPIRNERYVGRAENVAVRGDDHSASRTHADSHRHDCWGNARDQLLQVRLNEPEDLQWISDLAF